MSNNHQCLTCQKPITWQFAICANCEDIYGKSPLGWPGWLRFLWNDTQRERRRNRRIKNNEVSFSDLPWAIVESTNIDNGHFESDL
jgi:hypothetical protein